ncbi:HAT transposon superfamily [Actinidia rufa]|uniref:HAT transposon superfamily n=1 Tax=Actinidia rufa TaxID=165716 RepID=A0A7J0EC83_9ERIC|nr:HAT transposon superfamily [Actinidia rufa]
MEGVVREKDVCWEYADKLDGNKVRCKFCSRVLNGGISRLKHHLSRLPSKGVNPCSKVRDDVTDRVRAIIASKDEVKDTSSAKKQKPEEAKPSVNTSASKGLVSVEVASPVAKVFPSIAQLGSSPANDQENAERIGKCDSGFRGPSAETLKTIWLERIKSEVTLQSKDIEKEWATTDVSTYYKNIKCLADLFDSVIQDFGPENVVQIIVDNNLNCTEVHRGHEIVKTGITKPVSNFLSLQSMLKQRSRLKHMFNSPEFSANPNCANKPQSITCIGILDDGEFWRAVEECVAVSEPFLKVLREVSGGKPAVGFIYELMTRAKESMRTYYIMDEIKCKTFLDIVDKKWHNHLHSPFHSAAAFLNPSIQYNPEIKFLGSIKEDFFRVLEKLLPTPELRRDITNQILLFTRATGMFGCNLAKEAIDTVSPGIWWEQYGDSAPVLQRVAIRILSQVCSTSTLERQWSTFQQIHSEKRNKIDKETLNDLVYINYNLKLSRSMKSKSPEADPLQLDDINMTSEWVEEAESSSPTQWLDRFGSALDGSDLNTRQFSAAIFGASDHLFGL